MKAHGPILSTAIIGTGQIAGEYDRRRNPDETGIYTHAGAYRNDGRFRLQTVCDIDPEKASSFRQDWGAARWTTHLSDLAGGYHDVISICTPDKTHPAILLALIESRCCRTVFVEKPLAMSRRRTVQIIAAAQKANINVVVNYQRRFEQTYGDLRRHVGTGGGTPLLTATAHYIKGLLHIGTTMIDTLTAVCGYPQQVLAFNRVWNRDIKAYSYDFILIYPHYTVCVTTADSAHDRYNYHIFELDFLLRDRRITLTDCTRYKETRSLTGFTYSGVNVLDDGHPVRERTEFDQSMVKAIRYLHAITTGERPHDVNRPEHSYNNSLIIEKIILSYRLGCKVTIKETEWML